MRFTRLLSFAAVALLGLVAPARAGDDAAIVHVRVQAPGMSAEALEREVVVPLEKALAGLPALRALDTAARDGRVDATLTFPASTPDPIGRVRTRLARLEAPGRQIEVFEATASEVLYLAFTSAEADPDALSRAAREAARDLARVPRVARVASYGATEPELVIDLAPERLAAHGVPVAILLQALDALGSEAPRTHGEDLGALRLGPETRLSDVADLRLAAAPATARCALDGATAVVLAVRVDPEAFGATREALAAWCAETRERLAARGVTAVLVVPDREVRVEFPEGTSPENALRAVGPFVAKGHFPARHVLAVAGEAEGPPPGVGTPVRVLVEAPEDPSGTGELLDRLAAEVPGARVVAADGAAIGWSLRLSSPDGAQLGGALEEATRRLARALPDARLAPAGVEREPALEVHLDAERLAAHGLDKGTVERIVQAARGGLLLALRVAAGGRDVPVRVRYAGEPGDLGQVPVVADGGAMVPLRALGDVELASRPRFPVRHQGRAVVALRILPPDPPSRAALEPVLEALRDALPPRVTLELVEGTAFP